MTPQKENVLIVWTSLFLVTAPNHLEFEITCKLKQSTGILTNQFADLLIVCELLAKITTGSLKEYDIVIFI